jgi:hypothetical protein
VVALAHPAVDRELLHSLTLQVVEAALEVTDQISVGIVIQDILVATVAVDQLTHTIVLLTEQVVVVAQVFLVRGLTDLVADQIIHIQLAVVVVVAPAELADNLASHGQMVKVTVITVAETTEQVAVDLAHHMVVAMADAVQFELYGLEIPDHSQQLTSVHNYKYAC